MKIICFELTMPNVGSWNGKWTGEKNKYYIFKSFYKKTEPENLKEILERRSFYYNFGDGWGANVSLKEITASEKKKMQKVNKGFSGYDWMVDEILKHGKILTITERKELQTI